jgi:uncharacterized protein YlxW (UPF0749 family)
MAERLRPRGGQGPDAPGYGGVDIDPEGRPLPPQATMGLLNYVTAHALDEGYAHASAAHRTSTEDGAADRRPRNLATMLVLAVFGVLLATAGVQTARSEPASQSSKESLVAQVQDRREGLADARSRLTRLRAEVDQAQNDLLASTGAGRTLKDQLSELGSSAGTEAVTGPGVRITVDDSAEVVTRRQVVLDTDLQILVNGLWASGAEAVAINGQRLTTLSAIRVAGDAITVNLRSLEHPYVVEAIGNPDQLPARFVDSAAGTWWLNLQAVYDLQFEMTREDSLTLPAAPDVQLRHVRLPGGQR